MARVVKVLWAASKKRWSKKRKQSQPASTQGGYTGRRALPDRPWSQSPLLPPERSLQALIKIAALVEDKTVLAAFSFRQQLPVPIISGQQISLGKEDLCGEAWKNN